MTQFLSAPWRQDYQVGALVGGGRSDLIGDRSGDDAFADPREGFHDCQMGLDEAIYIQSSFGEDAVGGP